MASTHPWIRTRLSVMMFLEFLLWASWYVPIGGYMNSTLGFSGSQIAWIYTTTALGAIISPMLVGYVADRFFATERVLAFLHIIGGVCLFAAASQATFPALMTLLMINALCFMPTLALVNSISFSNIDDPNRFSRIAVWGTVGWIVSGLLVDFVLGGSASTGFFYLAGSGAIAMGLYCLTLPHTPPKGGGGDVLGLDALKLLKDPSFLVFAFCAFLISIPLSFYFAWGNAFLVETDCPRPTALQTLCQFSEIVMMVAMPWFIARIGLKNVLVVGMAAWALRYALFASMSFPLIILGLLAHGFCYSFVFVAGFIYVSRKAPAEIGASAQSFLAFLMWGVGMFVGMQLSGYVAEQYPAATIAAVQSSDPSGAITPGLPLPHWSIEEDGKTVNSLAKEFGSEDNDSIDVSSVEDYPKDSLTYGEDTYAKKDLVAAFKSADSNENGKVTSAEWRAAQAHDWAPIWLWPGALAAAVCLLFLVGGRDVVPAESQ